MEDEVTDIAGCTNDEDEMIEIQGDSYIGNDYTSWSDAFTVCGFDFAAPSKWDAEEVDKDCLIMPTMRCGSETLEPYLVWEQAKVAIFDELPNQHLKQLQGQGWHIVDTSISVHELKELLVERD